MKKLLYTLNLLVLASLLVAACGASATENPTATLPVYPTSTATATVTEQPTKTATPAPTATTLTNTCGPVTYSTPVFCRDDVVVLSGTDHYVGQELLIKVWTYSTPSLFRIHFYTERVKSGLVQGIIPCFTGDSLVTTGYQGYPLPTITTEYRVRCETSIFTGEADLGGTITYQVISQMAAALTPTVTLTPGPTITIDGVQFGEPRAIGTDHPDATQFSVIIWPHGEEGFVLSTSAQKVAEGYGDAGLTPMTPQPPTAGFEHCLVNIKGVSNYPVRPCYLYRVRSTMYSISVPGLVNPAAFVANRLPGGPTTYRPLTPRPSPTP